MFSWVKMFAVMLMQVLHLHLKAFSAFHEYRLEVPLYLLNAKNLRIKHSRFQLHSPTSQILSPLNASSKFCTSPLTFTSRLTIPKISLHNLLNRLSLKKNEREAFNSLHLW